MILIVVAIFADVLAPYRYDKNAPGRPVAGRINPVSPGDRPVGGLLSREGRVYMEQAPWLAL